MKQARSRPPLQILIVADGETEAIRLVEAVRLSGHEVEYARVESAEALLATLPLAPWDVVLCGYPLRQLTPRDALLAVRGLDADRPFIVAADSLPMDEVVALLKAGANDVVARDPTRLRDAVEREVKEASAQRARREAAQKQREDDEQRRLLIEEMPALTYVAWADDIGATVYVSPQVSAMTGFSTAEWLADPESWLRCIHAEDRERVLAEFRDCCATGRPFSAEYRIHDREGRVRWWDDQGRIIPAESGRSRFVRGFVADITDRKQAEETIRHMRYHDPLTGLPNKALLQERLAAAIGGARSGQSIGLLVLSLDGFREINNTLGALHADRLIQQIARRVGEVLGGEDRVARLRGDEFAMMLPDADARLAQQVASKVLRALEQPVMVERLPIEVAGSLGISVYPEHGNEPDALLRRADLAVQMAKREGRGCVLYSKECDPYDPRRLTLLGELRRALETDELVLFYQPKVDLKTRRVVGAEALVRWRHPKRGLVPPDDFIPLAEKGGLIKPLTRWVLGRAVARCHAWEGGRRPLSMAVNFSARNLHDGSLAGDVAALLASHGVPSGRLEAELTESAVMSDPTRAVETLRQLQASGVGISIDDFGIGQSSLSYLQTLPVTELKIDKSFVIGMASDGDSNAVIVRATSDLGHALGLTVVAEGVEDEATLERLTAFGCDKAQGYHIAKPMDAPAIERWLTDSPWAAE